jgi:hypothetical protein
MQLLKTTVTAAVLSLGLAASASAMPVPPLSTGVHTPQVDQVRLVCDRWGRCWRVGGGPGWRRAWGAHPGWRRGWRRW